MIGEATSQFLSADYTFFDPVDRERFWTGYGRRPSGSEEAAAQLRACLYGFALADYGRAEALPGTAALGEAILRRLVEE